MTRTMLVRLIIAVLLLALVLWGLTMARDAPEVSLDTVEGDILTAADLEFGLPGDGAELTAALLAPVPDPERGAGGELVPPVEDKAAGVLLSTLDKPHYVSAHASRSRLNIADKTGSLTLALDMAETVGAQNSAEMALAHQLAAAHAGAMNLLAQMREQAKLRDDGANVRCTRLAGAAARLMGAYQQGLLTLHKIRTGGRQEVHVYHQQNVQVTEGGQAVVAGQIGEGGPKSTERAPARKSKARHAANRGEG
jgi:hypothetical protein